MLKNLFKKYSFLVLYPSWPWRQGTVVIAVCLNDGRFSFKYRQKVQKFFKTTFLSPLYVWVSHTLWLVYFSESLSKISDFLRPLKYICTYTISVCPETQFVPRGGSGLIFWGLGFILWALVFVGSKNLLNKFGFSHAWARALLNKWKSRS
jgi:hypothetical protein